MRNSLAVIFLLLSVSTVLGQGTGGTGSGQVQDKMGLFTPIEIQWKEGPASLAKGAKMAVLEGDPAQEGLFTMRLWFPDGFEVAPHWHTQVEHATVISGILNFGMGEKFDRAATREMPAGSFGYWPVGMRHFAWTKGGPSYNYRARGRGPLPM